MPFDSDSEPSDRPVLWDGLIHREPPLLSAPIVRDATLTTLYNALTPSECAALIATAEHQGFTPEPRPDDPLHRQPLPATVLLDRLEIDHPALVQRLFERLAPWLPASLHEGHRLGLAPILVLHKHHAHQRIKPFKESLVTSSRLPGSQRRAPPSHRLTLLIPLTEHGGTMVFENGTGVRPPTGTALWFDATLRHQSEPVDQGVHYVLHAEVLYGDSVALAA